MCMFAAPAPCVHPDPSCPQVRVSGCGSHHLDQSCRLGGSDWPGDRFPSSLCRSRIPMLNHDGPIVGAEGEEIACEHSPSESRVDDGEA